MHTLHDLAWEKVMKMLMEEESTSSSSLNYWPMMDVGVTGISGLDFILGHHIF